LTYQQNSPILFHRHSHHSSSLLLHFDTTGLPLGINLGPDLQVLSFNTGKDGELPWISAVAGVSQGDFFTAIAGHSTHGLTPGQFADTLKQAIDRATAQEADLVEQQAAAVVKPVARPSSTAQAQYTQQQALLNAQANAAAAATVNALAGTVTLRVRPKQLVAEAAQHRALLSATQQYSDTMKRSEDSWHHMDLSIGALTVGSLNVTLADFSTAPQGCTEHAIVWAIPGTYCCFALCIHIYVYLTVMSSLCVLLYSR
jgi:hypothetical protein